MSSSSGILNEHSIRIDRLESRDLGLREGWDEFVSLLYAQGFAYRISAVCKLLRPGAERTQVTYLDSFVVLSPFSSSWYSTLAAFGKVSIGPGSNILSRRWYRIPSRQYEINGCINKPSSNDTLLT